MTDRPLLDTDQLNKGFNRLSPTEQEKSVLLSLTRRISNASVNGLKRSVIKKSSIS